MLLALALPARGQDGGDANATASTEALEEPGTATSRGVEVLAVRLRLVQTTLTRDQVFEALSREFDTKVVSTEGIHGLHLSVDGRILRASYQDEAEQRIERELELPIDQGAQLETIALLSGNLARDEVGALLVQLRAKQEDLDVVEPPPIEEGPEIGPEGGSLSEKPVPVQDGEADSESATAEEKQEPKGGPADPTTINPPAPEPVLATAPLSVSLYGDLAFPPQLSQKRVQAHLGAAFSEYGALQGADVTLGVSRNLGRGKDGAGRGAQLAVFWTRTDGDFFGYTGAVLLSTQLGHLKGVQSSALASYRQGETEGAQLSGAVGIARGNVDGAQIATGAAVLLGDLDGVQTAVGASWAGGRVDGAQLAVGLSFSRGQVDGFQLGGVTYAEEVDGAQIGLVNIVRRGIDGAQVGLVNVSGGDALGSQFGLVNVGGNVSGSQFGLLNIARDVEGVAIAPVNIIPGIRNQLVAYSSWAPSPGVEGGPSSPLVHLGAKFVPGPLYTQLSLGIGAEAEECPGNLPPGDAQCQGNGVVYAPGFALGVRGTILPWLSLEADAQYQFEKAFSQSRAHGHALLGRLALVAEVTDDLAFFAGGGPRLDVRVTDGPDPTTTPAGNPHVFAGIQVF